MWPLALNIKLLKDRVSSGLVCDLRALSITHVIGWPLATMASYVTTAPTETTWRKHTGANASSTSTPNHTNASPAVNAPVRASKPNNSVNHNNSIKGAFNHFKLQSSLLNYATAVIIWIISATKHHWIYWKSPFQVVHFRKFYLVYLCILVFSNSGGKLTCLIFRSYFQVVLFRWFQFRSKNSSQVKLWPLKVKKT